MRFLRLLFLCAAVVSTTVVAEPIHIHHVNMSTTLVPPPTGPSCLPTPLSSTVLSGKTAAFVVADGSNVDALIVADTFLRSRGVKITVVCADSNGNVLGAGDAQRALLMRMYYPLSTIECSAKTDSAGWSFSQYDLVVVPDGFTATLPMRRSANLQALLFNFVNNAVPSTVAHSLLLVGGASEMLIDAKVIEKLNCTEHVPISTTPSVATAVSKRCGASEGHKPTHHLSFGRQSIFIGRHHHDLPLMLARWEDTVLGTESPAQIICDNTTVPVNYTTDAEAAGAVPTTEDQWDSLVAVTDAHSEVIAGGNSTFVNRQCTNTNGVDFCDNALVSIVVAHGSHQRSVRSLAHVFSNMKTNNHIYCPDADEEHSFAHGHVYLSAEPSYVPTHRVKCTAYYNRTDILTSTLVIIPGGEIATHRTLRTDISLVNALRYTGTFSAFGSGLALLNAVEAAKREDDSHDVTSAPYFIPTNVDMDLLNLNASLATRPVLWFRNVHERRTKVLGAYRADGDAESAFAMALLVFMEDSAKSLVWENAPSGVADVALLVGIFGSAAVIIIGILIVVCVRSRSVGGRSSFPSRARTGSTITEPFSMKFNEN